MRRAGLVDIIGAAGGENPSGEQQQKLDVIANEIVYHMLKWTKLLCVMASEEDEEPVPIPAEMKPGKYVLLYDPLDGSTNIDVNVSIGTIFSIHQRVSPPGPGTLEDCLQIGRKQVAAGYVMHGSGTVLVYTTGAGVHMFTLDPTIGEFRLISQDIKTPNVGKYYSVNESYNYRWSDGFREVVDGFKKSSGNDAVQPKNSRYIGSLVADFHRNLLEGGVFLYPADSKFPRGKLRLLYEAAPLAFIAEQAGGAATDGHRPILDIVPEELHERTPLVIGSKDDVAYVQETLARFDDS